MHDSHQGFNNSDVRLELKIRLVVFAVKEQVFKQLLEQLHSKDFMVQICILS